MPLPIHWQQIALRLLLASVASFLIGLNRDEHGHPAGIRTTMLVCLAATLAMIQVNLLLPLAGRTGNSFVMNDLMRLPLGVLSGIGFIGAGVILKREHNVTGVTTAATMWYVTVLGLLFGGGQIITASVGSVLGITILWGIKRVEPLSPREHYATLQLTLDADAPPEPELRQFILRAGCAISQWSPTYDPAQVLSRLQCSIRWTERNARDPHTPKAIQQLRTIPGVLSVVWQE